MSRLHLKLTAFDYRFNTPRLLPALVFGAGLSMMTGCSQPAETAHDTAENTPSKVETETTTDSTTSITGETKEVAITAIVDHPALDSVRQGTIDKLKEDGFVDGLKKELEPMGINVVEAPTAKSKIPLVASETDSVAREAVAALGLDYYQIGKETGKLVTQVLNGTPAGDILVYRPTPDQLQLFVSPKRAAEQGITLLQSVLDRADKVLQ